MANNEILQIVVFSMFFGVALASLGEKAKTMIAMIDELAHAMLKITGYVMKLAPLAVFCAMAATVATNGLEILIKFAVFMGDFYLGLSSCWVVLIARGLRVLGPRIFQLMVLIKEPFMVSFATASSEAAYPKILDALDRFGVKRKISSFVMPMGYSFNLDGSMMYCTFATLFIAQAYNIELLDGHPDHDAPDPDADLQGHGGRAARIAGGDRRDPQPVQHPRGGAAADPRRRYLPRHGPLRDQRHRQLDRDRRGGEMGRRAAAGR
jgi:hypothetical protein